MSLKGWHKPALLQNKQTGELQVVVPWTTSITFLNRMDTYNFALGDRLFVRKPYTGLGRLWSWVTAPFRKRVIVIEVDYECGFIKISNDHQWYRFLREG